jgi:hypothetical protein
MPESSRSPCHRQRDVLEIAFAASPPAPTAQVCGCHAAVDDQGGEGLNLVLGDDQEWFAGRATCSIWQHVLHHAIFFATRDERVP